MNKAVNIFIIAFLYLGGVSMFVMLLHYFQDEITGILKNKEISVNAIYRFCLKLHIAFGLMAIFSGPMQFVNKVRVRYLKLHRTIGYLYFLSVVISAIVGLIVAQFAMGGIISRIGFSLLTVFWFCSIIIAVRHILNNNITAHKKWMYISYGLTFTAITQRTLLLIPLIINVEFISIYRLSAWLPRILNTVLAIYFFNRSELKTSSQKTLDYGQLQQAKTSSWKRSSFSQQY